MLLNYKPVKKYKIQKKANYFFDKTNTMFKIIVFLYYYVRIFFVRFYYLLDLVLNKYHTFLCCYKLRHL